MIGVPKSKLFRVNDLWDNVSIVNVVNCLVALSSTASSRWPDRTPTFEMPSDDKNDELWAQSPPDERAAIEKFLDLKYKLF